MYNKSAFYDDKNNINISSSGQIIYYDGTAYTTTATVPKYKWNHIAVSKEGTTVKIFLNGAIEKTFTSNVDVGTSARRANIGVRFDGSIDPTTGQISNLRIVKGTAVYTSDFTTPIEPLTNITNTKLICCADSSSTTAATVGSSLSTIGNPLVSGSNLFHKYSVFFDGSDDYLEMGSHSDIQFGTGDFTIELWWNGMSHGSYTQIIGTQSVFDANTGTWRILDTWHEDLTK